MRFADQRASIDAFENSGIFHNAVLENRAFAGIMDGFENDLEHPKKRRRRLDYKTPTAARLVGDESLRGVTSVVSDDLLPHLIGAATNTSSENF